MSQQVRVYRMLDLSPAALIPHTSTSRPYPVMRLGDRTTEVNVKMTGSVGAQHLDPVQFNLNITGANPSATSTINTIYQNITHDTTDMAALRLKCADWNISIAKNILDAYVYQGEVDITASSAIGSEVVGLGLTINVSAGTVTGLVRGAVIAMIGSSMPATTSTGLNINTVAPTGTMTLTHAIYLDIGGNTTLTNAIYIANTGTVTNFLKVGTAANFLDAGTTAGDTCIGHIRVSVPAGTGYINVFSDNS